MILDGPGPLRQLQVSYNGAFYVITKDKDLLKFKLVLGK